LSIKEIEVIAGREGLNQVAIFWAFHHLKLVVYHMDLIEEVVEVLVLRVVLPVLLLAHLHPPLLVEELRRAIKFVLFTVFIDTTASAVQVCEASAVLTFDSALSIKEIEVIAGRLGLNQVAIFWAHMVFIETVVENFVLWVIFPELLLAKSTPELRVEKFAGAVVRASIFLLNHAFKVLDILAVLDMDFNLVGEHLKVLISGPDFALITP
jgi:hypothetical protein